MPLPDFDTLTAAGPDFDSLKPDGPDFDSLQPVSSASLRGMGNKFLQTGQAGVGGMLKGAATILNTVPIGAGGTLPSSAYEAFPEVRELNAQRAARPPSQVLQEIHQDPVFIAGQALEETAPEVHPVKPEEEGALATRAAGMAGGFVPVLATGPLAPLAMGAQSMGEHITADYEQAKASGMTEDQAADVALRRAEASGGLQAGIFALLPPVLRAPLEKYLVNKMGATGFARWLAGRGAAATEGAALGGTSQIGENLIEGRRATEGVGASAVGLGASNLLFPWLREREGQPPGPATEQGGRLGEPSLPPPAPEQPSLASLPPAPTMVSRMIEEARAQKAAEEQPAGELDLAGLQAALSENRIPKREAGQEVQERGQVAAEPVKETSQIQSLVKPTQVNQNQQKPEIVNQPPSEQKPDREAAKGRLIEEGVTEQNAEALLNGEKTPSEVVEQQLKIRTSYGSADSPYLIIDENPDGTRTAEVTPDAGPAVMQRRNIGQSMPHDTALAMARDQGVERVSAILDDHGIIPRRPTDAENFSQIEASMDRQDAGAPGAVPVGPLKELTPGAEGESVSTAAPETETGGTALEPGTPVESTQAQIGAPPADASAETIPAEGSEESRSAAASRTRPISTNTRGWDLIDEVEGSVGQIDPALIKEANPDFKPTGAARKIFGPGGVPADQAARALADSGHFRGDSNQPDQFGEALNAAARGRVGDRRAAATENRLARQDSAWERDKGRPGPDQKTVVADDLNVGDTLKVRGAPLKVKALEFDQDGNVISVTLDDGAKYGTQQVPGGTELKVDKRSVRAGTEPAVTEETSGGNQRTRLAKPGEQGETRRGALEAWADEVLAGGGTHLGPDVLAAYAVKGAAVLARLTRQIALDFTEWSTAMVNEFGAAVAEHLGKIWPEALKVRRQEIADRLGEIGGQEQGPSRTLPEELKKERYALARESREVQRELFKSRDYVAELLRRMDKLGEDVKRSRDAGNGLGSRDAAEEFMAAMHDLEQVDPKLRNSVYHELVARGEIMGSKSGELPAGRTLGELTAWLHDQKVDSPGLTMRERFNLAQRVADQFNRGKDALARTADRVGAAWHAFVEQWKHPPTDGDFRRTVKEWFYQKQWTGLETNRWIHEIKGKVPSRLRRMALSVYLDAGGDIDLLRSQADLVPARFRPIWEAALRLTDGEKQVAERIRVDFEQKLEDAQTTGLLDKGRQDYGVPQVWATMPKQEGEYDPFGGKPRTPRRPGAKLDPRDPFFALERQTPSYFDGIMNGGVPKGLDVADLVGLYNAEFHNALADRAVIKELKDAKDPEGNPIVMIGGRTQTQPREGGQRTYFVDSHWRPRDAVTKDGRPYRMLDHWALKDWKFASRDADGNPIIVHGDFWVHPDYFRFLKNELGRSWLRDPDGGGKYFNWLLNSAAFLKASKFASATFHLATIGEHAMFHAVLPISRGVELDPARNPRLAGLMRNGMELGFGHQQELFQDGLASHGGIYRFVPGLADAMAQMSDFLFKRYIPAMKVRAGETVLERNLERYKGKLSEDQIYELTGQQMNAAFGMQNWRLMGANKTLIDMSRLCLTAPDFLLSRSKVIAQALKPYNREQRYFLLAQALFVYGASRALNLLLDDDPHWEPENALSVVYHGRAYSARFLVNDIYHLATNPTSFAQGRMGPLVRSGIEAITQRDMRTGARMDVPIETSIATFRAFQVLVKNLAEWLVPVGFEGFMPGSKGREETVPGQVALALVGVGSRKYTAQTQVWNWAREFNRASADPGVQLQQRRNDAEAPSERSYRKLDALLDAGDLEKAGREYEALLEEGHRPRGVAVHYGGVGRPFTGSARQETLFRQSLTPEETRIYQRAIAERQARQQAFQRMLDAVRPGAAPQEEVGAQ